MEVIRDVIRASITTWSDVECATGGVATIAFAPAPDAACRHVEHNEDGGNANVIMFQDYRWTYKSADNTLGKATVTYGDETGVILDADIELNHAFNELTTGDDHVAYDVQSILTHELGHLLGLDHSPDYDATMNASYEQGSTELRSIEADDAEGCAPPTRRTGLARATAIRTAASSRRAAARSTRPPTTAAAPLLAPAPA